MNDEMFWVKSEAKTVTENEPMDVDLKDVSVIHSLSILLNTF